MAFREALGVSIVILDSNGDMPSLSFNELLKYGDGQPSKACDLRILAWIAESSSNISFMRWETKLARTLWWGLEF